MLVKPRASRPRAPLFRSYFPRQRPKNAAHVPCLPLEKGGAPAPQRWGGGIVFNPPEAPMMDKLTEYARKLRKEMTKVFNQNDGPVTILLDTEAKI